MKVEEILNEAGFGDTLKRAANLGIRAVDKVVGGKTRGFNVDDIAKAHHIPAYDLEARSHEAKFVSINIKGKEYHFFSFEGSINAFFRYDIVPGSTPTSFHKGSKVSNKQIYQAIRKEGPTPIHIIDVSKPGDMSKITVTDDTI